jgi:hypothetical protein
VTNEQRAPITNEDRAREWLRQQGQFRAGLLRIQDELAPLSASLTALLDERERAGEAKGIEPLEVCRTFNLNRLLVESVDHGNYGTITRAVVECVIRALEPGAP